MIVGEKQIRRLMKARGWTQTQLADAVGVKQSTVSRWINQSQLPDPPQQARIMELLGVELPAGEPIEDAPPDFDEQTPRIGRGNRVHIRAGFIPEFDLRAGASYGGGYALQGQVNEGDNTYDADVVKAEWGIPASFLQGELRLHPMRTDVLAVDGPSMVPDLMPGDRVLIDRSHTDPRQGGIFAVREDGGVIIKHVEVVRGSDPPRIVCKSSNPTYAPFELILDGDNVAIIGRVAGRISRM
jgi:transcriptional regulator with XRE-family HTH domain